MQYVLKQFHNQNIIRCNCSQVESKKIVHLSQRNILRLTGQDVSDFLQGLMTNDIRHLQNGSSSLYSVFLNIKGRILFDTIIYKSHEDETFYVECDSNVSNNLIKHF